MNNRTKWYDRRGMSCLTAIIMVTSRSSLNTHLCVQLVLPRAWPRLEAQLVRDSEFGLTYGGDWELLVKIAAGMIPPTNS